MTPTFEAGLTAGYAVLLVGIAVGLEYTARRVHGRAELFKTAGFTFHQQLDVWQCPAGQHLHREAFDHRRATVRYRAPRHVCNRCSGKAACTDSDDGRLLEIRPDAWVDTTTARFHRGLSLVLLLLAEVALCAATLIVLRAAGSVGSVWLWATAAMAVALGTVAWRLARRFFSRETP